MAECEKLKADEKMYKSFANLKFLTEKALAKFYDEVNDIERSVTSEGV
jgi:hypothetical protein